MSRKELEHNGCEMLRSLDEYQLRFIIALAEKMFAKSGQKECVT